MELSGSEVRPPASTCIVEYDVDRVVWPSVVACVCFEATEVYCSVGETDHTSKAAACNVCVHDCPH